MRGDFDKVLTEDPRRGGTRRFREIRHCKENDVFDDEFSGGKESMMTRRRYARGQRKAFGDHLRPLGGFMAKNVGRLWDDVYSEICTTFDKRKFTNLHILQHVFRDFLEKRVRVFDGVVHEYNRWDGYKPMSKTNNRRWATYYVHPETGVLCSNYEEEEAGHKQRAIAEREAEKAKVFRKVSKRVHLYLENGVWYEYKIKDIPALRIEYRPPAKMQDEWESMTLADRERHGWKTWVRDKYIAIDPPPVHAGRGRYWSYRYESAGTGMYYASKRVASHKLLRKVGL